MHAKAAQHGLRVLRFDETHPSCLYLNRGSSIITDPIGAGSRVAQGSYFVRKRALFSPQDLHGFWGGGITVFPIQLLIPRIDNILALYI